MQRFTSPSDASHLLGGREPTQMSRADQVCLRISESLLRENCRNASMRGVTLGHFVPSVTQSGPCPASPRTVMLTCAQAYTCLAPLTHTPLMYSPLPPSTQVLPSPHMNALILFHSSLSEFPSLYLPFSSVQFWLSSKL